MKRSGFSAEQPNVHWFNWVISNLYKWIAYLLQRAVTPFVGDFWTDHSAARPYYQLPFQLPEAASEKASAISLFRQVQATAGGSGSVSRQAVAAFTAARSSVKALSAYTPDGRNIRIYSDPDSPTGTGFGNPATLAYSALFDGVTGRPIASPQPHPSQRSIANLAVQAASPAGTAVKYMVIRQDNAANDRNERVRYAIAIDPVSLRASFSAIPSVSDNALAKANGKYFMIYTAPPQGQNISNYAIYGPTALAAYSGDISNPASALFQAPTAPAARSASFSLSSVNRIVGIQSTYTETTTAAARGSATSAAPPALSPAPDPLWGVASVRYYGASETPASSLVLTMTGAVSGNIFTTFKLQNAEGDIVSLAASAATFNAGAKTFTWALASDPAPAGGSLTLVFLSGAGTINVFKLEAVTSGFRVVTYSGIDYLNIQSGVTDGQRIYVRRAS